jgi:TFIIF-interacting CTD phosphatase-like protein
MTNKKPDIVLDIDETLIYSIVFDLDSITSFENACCAVKQCLLTRNNDLYYYKNRYSNILFLSEFILNDCYFIIFKRPYLIEFIEILDKHFDISFYSLGFDQYIIKIINKIIEITNIKPKNVWFNTKENYKLHKNLCNIDIDYNNCLIIDDRMDVWVNDTNKLYNIKKFSHINYIDIELKKIIDKINNYLINNNKFMNCNDLLSIL